MIKVALFKPFRNIFRIIFYLFLAVDIFGKSVSQPPELFEKPLLKCWEIADGGIETFASDNDLLILSFNNGNTSRLDKVSGEEIWKTSIGSNNQTIIKIIEGRIFVISRENFSDSKNSVTIREMEEKTGIVRKIEKFPDQIKLSNFDNNYSNRIYFTNSNSEITRYNLTSAKTDLTIKDPGSNTQNSLIFGNDEVFALAHDEEISLYKLPDINKVKQIKSDSENIAAITSIDNIIIWGDDSGRVFRHDYDSNNSEKFLRAGGKISFILNVGKNVLITSNDNFLYFYSPDKKKVLWKKRLSGRVMIEPLVKGDFIAITTGAEPEISFIRKKNGKTFNRTALKKEEFIKNYEIDDSSLFVQTNSGLYKFDENCAK